jgi:hypothetical protein
MDDEPWDGYDRDRTWSGWSYPIGCTTVEAALREAGVRLLSLHFRQPAGSDPDVVYLLQADRYADLGATYGLRRGTPNRRRNTLALCAVPGAVRPQATAALTTGGALQRACAWLAAAEDADPTWLDRSHTWATYLHHGALRWQQTEH